jgi:hypothetical protein
MNWKIFLIKFIRNVVLAVLLGVVLMGGFGYLLSGKEGLVNMAYWGLAIGLIGGFFSGIGLIFESKFWGDGNFQIMPEWNWFIKKSEDDKQKKNY